MTYQQHTGFPCSKQVQVCFVCYPLYVYVLWDDIFMLELSTMLFCISFWGYYLTLLCVYLSIRFCFFPLNWVCVKVNTLRINFPVCIYVCIHVYKSFLGRTSRCDLVTLGRVYIWYHFLLVFRSPG